MLALTDSVIQQINILKVALVLWTQSYNPICGWQSTAMWLQLVGRRVALYLV